MTNYAIAGSVSGQSNLAARVAETVNSRSTMEALLEDKRSENTRRAYEADLRAFFRFIGDEPGPESIDVFLRLKRHEATALVLSYKADMRANGYTEATINRRLSALRSLVKMGRKLGRCDYTLEDVDGDRAHTYRDTSGISRGAMIRLLSTTAADGTESGIRDYAILRLLWELALRRAEISSLDVDHIDLEARTVQVLGKGMGTQRVRMEITERTVDAIKDWLAVRPTDDDALFYSLSNSSVGMRISGNGVYWVVKKRGENAQIEGLTPHKLRHTAITAALEYTNGNISKVQKFSRHASPATVMIYDDNRGNAQGEITAGLGEIA